jgi:murein DD-endopeptidase MepM/ murein hydrolase activator NlpD
VYPADAASLPAVFAPFAGIVVAKAVAGTYVTADGGPRRDYPADDIYGNFAWVRSTEQASAGYFAFFCHLQDDAVSRGLVAGSAVTRATRLGTMGDTGNAAGTPQLHVELHYPSGANFRCSLCKPKTRMTAMNPTASLRAAAPRS